MSLLRGRNCERPPCILERFGAGFPYDDMSAEVGARWKQGWAQVPLRPGCSSCWTRCAPELQMAVASSTDSARVLHNLETAGVRGYFSAVIGGDQVTHSKPEPEIFLKAAAALDTPPGLCMVLEDSYNGVRAGAAAGCFTVMVPDMDPPTPEMERLAWAIVPGLTDVARLLEQTDLQKR
ncbi:MAG: HAD family hydrolase [Ruthenibacterium lactatiformans]